MKKELNHLILTSQFQCQKGTWRELKLTQSVFSNLSSLCGCTFFLKRHVSSAKVYIQRMLPQAFCVDSLWRHTVCSVRAVNLVCPADPVCQAVQRHWLLCNCANCSNSDNLRCPGWHTSILSYLPSICLYLFIPLFPLPQISVISVPLN